MREIPVRPPEAITTEDPGPWTAFIFSVLYYPAAGRSKFLTAIVNWN